MHFFLPEVSIDDYEGFTAKKDIFKYRSFGEELQDVFLKAENPLVTVLDAPWGSGKTTFIKMWCGHLRKQGIPVVYFDAFQNDYFDDAFMALAGEVFSLASGRRGEVSEEVKSFSNKAAKVALALCKGVGKGALKKVAGDEGSECITEVFASGGSEVLDCCERLLQERLEHRKDERDLFEGFKNKLGKLVMALGQSSKGSEQCHFPLIFVVDELDRCKPSFALALLEKVKHFFSIPNVHFLLVTNLEQLGKIVEGEYGTGISSTRYLQKFYDISFSLPTYRFAGMSTNTKSVFCNYLETFGKNVVQYAQFEKLVIVKQMSFRSIGKMYTYSAVLLPTVENDKVPYGVWSVCVTLACMKVEAPQIFYKAVSGTLNSSEIDSFLGEEPDFVKMKECLLFANGDTSGSESDRIMRAFGWNFDSFDAKNYLRNTAEKLNRMNLSY